MVAVAQASSLWQYASVSTINPQSNSPVGFRFTNRKPISSVALLGGAAEDGLVKYWEDVVGVKLY